MARWFNVAGPCRPDIHYMLPATARLPDVMRLITQQSYFVLHAPRQTGKTTAMLSLAQELTASRQYTAAVLSVEVGAPFSDHPDAAELAILDAWRGAIMWQLAPDLQPPPWPITETGRRIGAGLAAWAQASSRPLVLFLDEIDADNSVMYQSPLNIVLPTVTLSYVYEIAGGKAALGAAYFSEQNTFVLGNNAYQEKNLNSYGEGAWKSCYLAMKDLNYIKEKALAENAMGYVGISHILRAFIYSSMVDLFGNIPYSQAVNINYAYPEFDTPESIYADLQLVLDTAIACLTNQGNIKMPDGDDYFFENDTAMWIKTAHALKARLYNRLTHVDTEKYATLALAEVAKAYAGPSENFVADFYENTNENGNPFCNNQYLQPLSAVGNGIYNAMLKFSANDTIDDDPRASIWFTLADRTKTRIPAPNGSAKPDFGDPKMDGSRYSKPNIYKYRDALQPLLTYAELKFIEAEANLVLGH
ncbi:MAG: SusD/RagB family nutrient-binding outer membrane lipoprotein, partial [Oscillochloris sp.]|nr:SusD/RagB family nutrient-binding outer membrane lipoprotein [Oscillochloris sp.]